MIGAKSVQKARKNSKQGQMKTEMKRKTKITIQPLETITIQPLDHPVRKMSMRIVETRKLQLRCSKMMNFYGSRGYISYGAALFSIRHKFEFEKELQDRKYFENLTCGNGVDGRLPR